MPTIQGAGADSASSEQGAAMPKAYIVTTYRSISNPDAFAEYAKLAAPAMIAAGGRFLARGNADIQARTRQCPFSGGLARTSQSSRAALLQHF
jgi:hypothetical protein